MAETTGPSTTVPPSSNQSSQVAPQQSQHPQASAAAPEPTVRQTETNTERFQAVPDSDNKTSAQGQNLNTGGFRSSSGVPSEDELAQLYSNDAQASQVIANACALPSGGEVLPNLHAQLCIETLCFQQPATARAVLGNATAFLLDNMMKAQHVYDSTTFNANHCMLGSAML